MMLAYKILILHLFILKYVDTRYLFKNRSIWNTWFIVVSKYKFKIHFFSINSKITTIKLIIKFLPNLISLYNNSTRKKKYHSTIKFSNVKPNNPSSRLSTSLVFLARCAFPVESDKTNLLPTAFNAKWNFSRVSRNSLHVPLRRWAREFRSWKSVVPRVHKNR